MFVSGCNNEMVEKLILIKSQQSRTTKSTKWQSGAKGANGSDTMEIVHESILLNETAKSSESDGCGGKFYKINNENLKHFRTAHTHTHVTSERL